MGTTLRAYVEERVNRIRQATGRLDLKWQDAPSSPNENSVPARFAGKDLGKLTWASALPEELRPQLEALAAQLAALLAQPAEKEAIALDRRIEALHEANCHYDWTGVYKLSDGQLKLAAFRGSPSPHEIIPAGSGICGAAVTENQTLNIPDVGADPRYLSCDFRTRSEIVVPIRNAQGAPIGEIDIDSHKPDAFTHDDARQLEQLALELAPVVIHLI